MLNKIAPSISLFFECDRYLCLKEFQTAMDLSKTVNFYLIVNPSLSVNFFFSAFYNDFASGFKW